MARIRTVKPTHWQDKELSKISLPAHLLWIASWNFSDDKGIFEADVLLLKAQIFPRRTDIRVDQVSQWLDQLVKARFIIPFTFEYESYYITRTFETHQRIDKPQPSKIPDEIIFKVFQEHSKNIPRTILPVKDSKVIVEESSVQVYRKFAHLKISFNEFDQLNIEYTKKEIDAILDDIQNYKKNTNYNSLYLTALKWLKKEHSQEKKQNGNTKFTKPSKFDTALEANLRIKQFIENEDLHDPG